MSIKYRFPGYKDPDVLDVSLRIENGRSEVVFLVVNDVAVAYLENGKLGRCSLVSERSRQAKVTTDINGYVEMLN